MRMEPFLVISKGRMVKVKENGKNAANPIKFCCPGMYSGADINNGRLYMKIMNRCAKAQCAAAGGKKIDGLDHANVDPAGGSTLGWC